MRTTRRHFLRNVPSVAAGIHAGLSTLNASAPGRAVLTPDPRQYEAEVPDTLDLVESAHYALNGLTGTLDWEGVPEFYFRVTLNPPSLVHDALSFAACGPKYWESFPMMRVITASDRNQDIEKRYRDYMVNCFGEDGLFYCKIGPERPWDKTSPEDYANIYGQGRMIRALLAQYDYDGNPDWLARARKIANRLAEIAIHEKDYVYYPTTPGYGDIFSYPKSGWKATQLLRGPQATMADLPDHTMGIPMYLGGTILPLVRCAEATRDEKILELAGQLTRFLMLPDSGWIPDGYSRGVWPAEHGQFRGHFHGHVMALRGILAYGVAANELAIKNFARDGYEFARTLTIARLGWCEEYAGKHSHETCCLADMIPLAIHLSEQGVGDYWDDIDGYVRNHLSEGQFNDLEKLKRLNPTLTPEQEKVLERSVGTYVGWGTPVAMSTVLQNCCMANGSQALYAAWDSIVKYEDGTARVNLLLNRASPWIDADSYLPYEGKVVLHNKLAQRVHIRIPAWVDRNQVRCSVQGRPAKAVFLGKYLLLEPVPSPSTIKVTFPAREETETYTCVDFGDRGRAPEPIGRYKYRVKYRCGTAVEVVSLEGDQQRTYEGGKHDASVYPAYQDRGDMARNTSPMKKVLRQTANTVIRSW